MDVTLLDDFRELSLDRPTHTTKPLEELERLTVDEDLSPVERAVYLLSSGQEIQRVSVVNGLSDLLTEHNAEGLRRVVPKVREVLHVAQAEMQLAACAAFLQILQRQLVPVQNYTQTFLQSILTGIDSKDPDVASAWLETLLDVIELLPKDVIKKDIMSMAIAKGQLAQPVQSRLFCCQILGKTATKFEPFVIKKDILPVVQSLCQDIDYEVRGCMCRQLDPVARGLGLEQTKNAILPELVELTNDEESFVRIAGIETVASMMTLLDDETRSTTIVPLVCKFCQQSIDSNDVTLPVVAKLIGKICHGLSSQLIDDKRRLFIDWYKQLCRIGDNVENNKPREDDNGPKPVVPSIPMFAVDFLEEADQSTECRKNAAFNLPAMVLFIGVRTFKTELHSVMKAMCADPSTQVRKAVAAGFHEVLTTLGGSCSTLLPDFLTLLRDDNIEVLQGLVENFDVSIKMLSSYCVARPSIISKGNVSRSSPVTMVDVTPAVLSCEEKIAHTNNWRLQEMLFSKLECLPECYASDHIHFKYIPLFFNKLSTARALPVRRAIMRTLLICMRRNARQEQRTDILNKIINDFGHGDSCHQRSLFIDACGMVIELFSRNFFKTTLFEHLVGMAMDPVPNIRMRLCPMLPLLKGLIKFPTDRALLQSLEQCIRKVLVNEKDKDVIGAIDQAIHTLDRVHVRMETELSRKRGSSLYEEDEDDRTKEAQEQNLITLEENERKEDVAQEVRARKKDKGGRHDIVTRIPGPKKNSSKSNIPTTSTSTASGSTSGKYPPITRGTAVKGPRKTSVNKGSNNSSSGSPVPGRRSAQSSASSTTSSRKSSASSVSSALNNRRMSTGGATEVIDTRRRKDRRPSLSEFSSPKKK